MPKHDKKKYINFTTPQGTAKFPHLNKPDIAFDSEGKYKTEILVSPEDAKGLLDLIHNAAIEEFGAHDLMKVEINKKMTDVPIKVPFKVDEETGQVAFKAQTKINPKFFDAKGQVVPPSALPRLSGGSQLKLRGFLNVYSITKTNVGVSMTLQDVQIIEAVSPNGDPGGFAPVEGGFTVDVGAFESTEKTASNFDF